MLKNVYRMHLAFGEKERERWYEGRFMVMKMFRLLCINAILFQVSAHFVESALN